LAIPWEDEHLGEKRSDVLIFLFYLATGRKRKQTFARILQLLHEVSYYSFIHAVLHTPNCMRLVQKCSSNLGGKQQKQQVCCRPRIKAGGIFSSSSLINGLAYKGID
jgi:hypothetical protein